MKDKDLLIDTGTEELAHIEMPAVTAAESVRLHSDQPVVEKKKGLSQKVIFHDLLR
ncbi:manganese catalase family protein [Bacillus badius]|uniref:manganese catalase family protein n=1 Tax=Bacillus badius TaxID=1455 RepID=UPI0005ADA9DD|nr:manganese catalase family protein [Bacillus badius]KIL74924.1 hypothetical protein SD78_1993 [Bacillus badius]